MESSVPVIELDDDEGKDKQIITLDELDDDFEAYKVPVVTLEDDVANEPLIISLDDDQTENVSDILPDNQNREDSCEGADIICDGALKPPKTHNDQVSDNLITLDDSDHQMPEKVNIQPVPFIKIESSTSGNDMNFEIETDVLSFDPLKSISNSNTKHQECKKCHKMFPTVQKLNSHPCTTSKIGFKCGTCGFTCLDKNELSKHTKTHLGGKPYICDICFKEFSDKNILRMHYNTHTGEKPFACTICDKVFPNTLALKNHYVMHTGEKPYVCDVCLASFDQNSSLCDHKLEEHKFLTVI